MGDSANGASALEFVLQQWRRGSLALNRALAFASLPFASRRPWRTSRQAAHEAWLSCSMVRCMLPPHQLERLRQERLRTPLSRCWLIQQVCVFPQRDECRGHKKRKKKIK